MNLPEGLPSSGTPGLAALAAESAVLRRAASLAGWAEGGKRTLTAKGVLRKQDVPAAAAAIGVKAPQAIRSAADLPELHVAWCAAIGMGLLTVEGTEAAAAALYEAGPDEALCCIWDTIDGDDVAERLAGVRASGHPEAEQVASSVEACVASGAPLTIRQGVQLKVALRYAKPPVWRSVQLPLTATLGDLHAAIQVLFGWDGDHLHVFRAGGVRYSDPFYELEQAEDEDGARLRDVFPPGGPKITYVYDFGANWVHEITRQKVITLEPGQDYPVCVA